MPESGIEKENHEPVNEAASITLPDLRSWERGELAQIGVQPMRNGYWRLFIKRRNVVELYDSVSPEMGARMLSECIWKAAVRRYTATAEMT